MILKVGAFLLAGAAAVSLAVPASAQKQTLKMAYWAGPSHHMVKTQAEWEAAKAGDTDTEIDETLAIGRQCCIAVKAEKYTAADGSQKDKTDTGFAIWAPDAPEAKNTPKDAEMFALYLSSKGGEQPAAGTASGVGDAPKNPPKTDWSKF